MYHTFTQYKKTNKKNYNSSFTCIIGRCSSSNPGKCFRLCLIASMRRSFLISSMNSWILKLNSMDDFSFLSLDLLSWHHSKHLWVSWFDRERSTSREFKNMSVKSWYCLFSFGGWLRQFTNVCVILNVASLSQHDRWAVITIAQEILDYHTIQSLPAPVV